MAGQPRTTLLASPSPKGSTVNTKSILTTAAIALVVVIAHQKVAAGGGVPGVKLGA